MTTYRTPLPKRPRTDDVWGRVAALLILVVPLGLLGGVVGRYAWDVVVLHVFTGAPHINLAEVLGLTTILTYYTYSVSDEDAEKAVVLIVTTALFRMGVFVGTIWVLHFFIPGAH